MITFLKQLLFIVRTALYQLLFFFGVFFGYFFLWLMIQNTKNAKRYYWATKIPSVFACFGLGFYPKIIGKDRDPKLGAAVYVINHSSLLDVPLLYLSLNRPTSFIGKKELAKFPLFGTIYKGACVLIDRKDSINSAKGLAKADEKIKNGISMTIFPEGGVPKNASIKLGNLKKGAFSIAIRNQVPIIPITLPDNKKCLPYKAKNPLGRIFGPLKVVIHPPIETKGMTEEKDIQGLMQQVKGIMEKSLAC